MNNTDKEGYSVDPITRHDLDEALDRQATSIKEHINLKFQPMNKSLGNLQRTVYGRTGSNGLAGSVKVLKWGYALLAGVLIFFAKSFFEL